MKKIFPIFSLVLLVGSLAHAYANRCSERFIGQVQGICKDRVIPAAKARNFHSNSHQLVCASGVDHYFRNQQNFDFEKWNNLLRQDDAAGAQNMRKTQPDIAWSGTVPYQTVETWTWESCDLVTSGMECGYDTKTRTVTKSRRVCSGSGKNQSCRDESYTDTETYQEPRTCWADVSHSEAWPCSNEKIQFTARFQRPDYSQWKPGAPEYLDAIPNKYDLLPGEVEDVQIFSNTAATTRLNPNVEVGNGWNKYQFSNSGSAMGAVCRQDDHLNLDVKIYTMARNTNKKTPNAFRLPKDITGKAQDPIVWEPKKGADGQLIAEGVPLKLRLADTSSSVISTLAEQSQKTADREATKQKSGQGQTPDKMSGSDQVKAGFFKNTKVRVQLVKKNKHLWDTTATRGIFLDQGEGIVPTTNVLSDDQEVAFSDIWEINLRKDSSPGAYSSSFFSRDRGLRPGQEYYFEVSMYQKGARGLYLQDCDESPSFWACKFRWLGLGRTENKIFSEPIQVSFETKKNMVDERGFIYQIIDWIK